MKTHLITFFLFLTVCSLSAQLNLVEALTDGGKDHMNNTINGIDRPYGVLVSPDNKHFYVASIDDNSITLFDRNISTGQLTFIESLSANGRDQANNLISGLLGAVNIAMSADGAHLYVACLGNNVTVFSRNTSTGILTYVETLINGGRDQAGNTITALEEAVHIDISPDGKSVYVTSRKFEGFAVFSRDETTGVLTFLEAMRDDGKDQAGNIMNGIRKPYGIRVSLDNRFVYVASTIEHSIAVFSRNTSTGILTFVEVLSKNGSDQAGNALGTSIMGSNNITFSLDNEFLYHTATSQDAVNVFSRNTATGVLTFVQTLKNNTLDESGNTVTDLNLPQVIFVTANRAYVGTGVGRSVVVFERDAITGKLTFLESKVDEFDGITTLNDPEGLTLSRDHRFIYATGDEDNAITVFKDMQVPLPVELIYFKGKVLKDQVLLFWETASELENKGFYVERAMTSSLKQWEEIGFVKGKGTSLEDNGYEYLDQSPNGGINYYRLRQLDLDGTITYSQLVALSFKQEKGFLFYPNPSNGLLQIRTDLKAANFQIRIFELNGKLVKDFLVTDKIIDIRSLPNGNYTIELRSEQNVYQQLILKN